MGQVVPIRGGGASTHPFGPQLAECGRCELQAQCQAAKWVGGEVGQSYQPGGMMLIGEGAGLTEVSQRRPFVGRAGQLLNAILDGAVVDRAACWVSNATLCLPPTGGQGQFHERFPNAIYSCLPRLEAEIAQARPRVIVTLGQAAFVALSGHELVKTRLVKFDCDFCNPDRKIGPALQCAVGGCDWYTLLEGEPADAAVSIKEALGGQCPKCSANIKRLRPRQIKCPQCGGRKMRSEEYTSFGFTHTLIGREGVAGAIFEAAKLPSRLDEFGVKYIIPTYHPAYCLHSIKQKGSKRIGGQFAARASADHIEKARELLARDAKFEVETHITTDPAELRAFVRGAGVYAVDIETDSEEGPWRVNTIECFGVARVDRKVALVVDTRAIGGDMHLGNPLLDEIHRFCLDPSKQKVLQNGSYDRVVMARVWGIDVEGVVGDTLLAHNACYPDEEHGLGFIAHELTDAPAWKPPRKHKGRHVFETFQSLADYNAIDTRATALAWEKLVGADGKHGGRVDIEKVRPANELDTRMQEIAIEMELTGMPVSEASLRAIGDEAYTAIDENLGAMREITHRPDFDPNKRSQLLWALFDDNGPLQLTATGRTPTGEPSTKKEHLLKLADQPFVQHLLRWRKYDKIRSTYVEGDGLKIAEDGRIHPTWKVWGARTGRWSSSPNFQNWPKALRRAIVAPPGRKLVGADYSQLEMRVMAALSGDPELIRRCAGADESDKLNPEKDPHAYVAALTFGKTYWDAYNAGDRKTCDALRTITKRTVYGLNYGAGPSTVLDAIYDGGYEGPPITRGLIERVIKVYFEAFSGVPTWREQQLRLAHERHEIRTPLIGRHRSFPCGEIDATVIYNYPIQGGAADIMSQRLEVLHTELGFNYPSACIIAQVHDAVYVECDAGDAEAVADLIEDTLSVTWSLREGGMAMPFVASAAIADTWDKAA